MTRAMPPSSMILETPFSPRKPARTAPKNGTRSISRKGDGHSSSLPAARRDRRLAGSADRRGAPAGRPHPGHEPVGEPGESPPRRPLPGAASKRRPRERHRLARLHAGQCRQRAAARSGTRTPGAHATNSRTRVRPFSSSPPVLAGEIDVARRCPGGLPE